MNDYKCKSKKVKLKWQNLYFTAELFESTIFISIPIFKDKFIIQNFKIIVL